MTICKEKEQHFQDSISYLMTNFYKSYPKQKIQQKFNLT